LRKSKKKKPLKKIPIASSEEIQEFFEEDQRIKDKKSRKVVAEASEKAKQAIKLNSGNIKHLVYCDEDVFWNWWGATTQPDIHSVEVLPAGGPKRGGGSRNRSKKDKKGNLAYEDPWTDI